jgi:hypothetical protein
MIPSSSLLITVRNVEECLSSSSRRTWSHTKALNYLNFCWVRQSVNLIHKLSASGTGSGSGAPSTSFYEQGKRHSPTFVSV